VPTNSVAIQSSARALPVSEDIDNEEVFAAVAALSSPSPEPMILPAALNPVEPAVEPTVEPAVKPTIEPAVEPAVEPAIEPAADTPVIPPAE
jgi:hypothetical protein